MRTWDSRRGDPWRWPPWGGMRVRCLVGWAQGLVAPRRGQGLDRRCAGQERRHAARGEGRQGVGAREGEAQPWGHWTGRTGQGGPEPRGTGVGATEGSPPPSGSRAGDPPPVGGLARSWWKHRAWESQGGKPSLPCIDPRIGHDPIRTIMSMLLVEAQDSAWNRSTERPGSTGHRFSDRGCDRGHAPAPRAPMIEVSPRKCRSYLRGMIIFRNLHSLPLRFPV